MHFSIKQSQCECALWDLSPQVYFGRQKSRYFIEPHPYCPCIWHFYWIGGPSDHEDRGLSVSGESSGVALGVCGQWSGGQVVRWSGGGTLTNRVKRLFGEQKFQKSNIFLEGSGHQNFMNPFVYGKSFLGKSFSKKIGTLTPPNPKIHQNRPGQIGLRVLLVKRNLGYCSGLRPDICYNFGGIQFCMQWGAQGRAEATFLAL